MKKLFILLCAAVVAASCGSESNTASTGEAATEPAAAMSNGKKMFVNNCVQCHNITKDRIGPKLEGVLARWDNDTARIHAFIKDSRGAAKAGDPRAVQVLKDWNESPMPPMPHLTDGEINEILEYIGKGIE